MIWLTFEILGHGACKPHNTKMKLFITDGSDAALRGDCLVFTKLKSDTVITVHNISQVRQCLFARHSADRYRKTCGF